MTSVNWLIHKRLLQA